MADRNKDFTCPKCGIMTSKKSYESRHKGSKRCKSNQEKYNKA